MRINCKQPLPLELETVHGLDRQDRNLLLRLLTHMSEKDKASMLERTLAEADEGMVNARFAVLHPVGQDSGLLSEDVRWVVLGDGSESFVLDPAAIDRAVAQAERTAHPLRSGHPHPSDGHRE